MNRARLSNASACLIAAGEYRYDTEPSPIAWESRASLGWYVSRMVNLTTLAPDIVAAILDETLPDEVTLFDLAAGAPVLWDEQRERVESNDDVWQSYLPADNVDHIRPDA
jgi:hypothetical protein